MEHVADEAVHKELGHSLVRAATIASSLETKQDSGNKNRTQSKATPNESSSQGTDSGGGPRCQEAMRDTIAQTRFENVTKLSNDSLLARGNKLQSDEDRLKPKKVMELCTNLQTRFIDLEKTKTTQANEIDSLKGRVKKLERRNKSRTHKLKRLYKVGMTASVEFSEDEDNLDLGGEEVFVEQEVVANKGKIDEVTLAQALVKLKTSKPKAKGVVIREPREELEQQRLKKQKVDDDKETSELKKLMEIISNEEEVAIDAIPLAVKSPWIVNWKIYKEGKKSYY
nr:hypothetical protein [Tanacetum cinerariifolium]